MVGGTVEPVSGGMERFAADRGAGAALVGPLPVLASDAAPSAAAWRAATAAGGAASTLVAAGATAGFPARRRAGVCVVTGACRGGNARPRQHRQGTVDVDGRRARGCAPAADVVRRGIRDRGGAQVADVRSPPGDSPSH